MYTIWLFQNLVAIRGLSELSLILVGKPLLPIGFLFAKFFLGLTGSHTGTFGTSGAFGTSFWGAPYRGSFQKRGLMGTPKGLYLPPKKEGGLCQKTRG